jgi:uncharacterized phiE125 gp8 family phage protein
MRYVRTSPAIDDDAFLVVELATFKAHLRIEGADEDDILKTYLRAAATAFDGREGFLNRVIVPGTFHAFAAEADCLGGFDLDLGPIRDVTDVAVLDDGTYEAVDADDWDWSILPEGSTAAARVFLADGSTWPDAEENPNAFRIAFTAGPATISDIPEAIRVAVMLKAAFLYGNRGESNQGGEPPTVAALLNPYRRFGA